MRCSTSVSLLRSSCEAVASFARVSAREFFALGMCLAGPAHTFSVNPVPF